MTPLTPLLLPLLLLSLFSLSPSCAYEFSAYSTSACSLALHLPVLSTAISIPSLAAGTGQCSPLTLPPDPSPSHTTPSPPPTPTTVGVRFTFTPLHPLGVNASFTLYTAANCSEQHSTWQIRAHTTAADTVRCEPASFIEVNHTSGERSTRQIWVTIDPQPPAPSDEGGVAPQISVAVITGIVVAVVAVAGLVVAVIWWCNRTQQSSLTMLRPDRAFHSLA